MRRPFKIGRSIRLGLLLLFSLVLAAGCTSVPGTPTPTLQRETAPTPDPYLQRRLSMVENHIMKRGVTDPAVLSAIENTPRHEFVPADYVDQAYVDHALPIGYGQTISQPYIVAVMTELLRLKPGDKVLEIGTGSGYQAAVLAEIVGAEAVYTIEIITALQEQAADRFERLGYEGILTRFADGYYGWDEHAPFDAIIVTAAPDHVPQPLLQQLADGGRLVIPVGPRGLFQTLWLFTKEEGEVKAEQITGVSFVPLTREER